MAGRTEVVSAQVRQALAQHITDRIQAESDPQRKAALGQYLGQAMSDMVGMTGEDAEEHLRTTLNAMKDIV